jgi:hypothetical protein
VGAEIISHAVWLVPHKLTSGRRLEPIGYRTPAEARASMEGFTMRAAE